MIDAISASLAGAARAREALGDAAHRVSRSGLAGTDPTVPERNEDNGTLRASAAEEDRGAVDVGEQLTVARVARQNHAANLAAMRAAHETYRAVRDLVGRRDER